MSNELSLVRRFKKCQLTLMDYYNCLVFLKPYILEHRRVLLSLRTFYDIYHNFVCCNILDYFVCHNTGHVLRCHSHKLFIPFCKTNMRKNFLSLRLYICGTLYLVNVINANIRKAFVNRLCKTHLSNYMNF